MVEHTRDASSSRHAWRYAGGSEAKAMALCYTTIELNVRLSSVARHSGETGGNSSHVCQVKMAITGIILATAYIPLTKPLE